MSEEQQYQGDRWTTQSRSILESLGWLQKGDSNFDIQCKNKTKHGTGKSSRIHPHGVDLLFQYKDPYAKEDKNIIVESKHRKWGGISTSSIQSFVTQVFDTIECANISQELSEIQCIGVNTGLIMIWCNEPEKFNNETFNGYLKEINIRTKRNPITIYIASNYHILRWCSVIDAKDKLLAANERDFKIYYPADNFSGGRSTAVREDHATLPVLFSKYIFAKSTRTVESYGDFRSLNVNHVFYFAEPTYDELLFLYSCLSQIQFEDAHILSFFFYGNVSKYRVYIEEFRRKIEHNLKKNGSALKVEINYMVVFSDVPEIYAQEKE
ncbi:hypothetical protein [Lysinibacillus sp. NPDC093688]|uniref:hypothetical protein n=1 Tax=Lysinibacillus sp. NPDC093688 TaxID=3390577 RepID=UPI003D045085